MARLNVAVEAVRRKVETDTALSIYITDTNREPVTGLNQGAFKVTRISHANVPTISQFSGIAIPGVYRILLSSQDQAYGSTFGVEVKRTTLPGGIGGPLLEEHGFGLASAVRDV